MAGYLLGSTGLRVSLQRKCQLSTPEVDCVMVDNFWEFPHSRCVMLGSIWQPFGLSYLPQSQGRPSVVNV